MEIVSKIFYDGSYRPITQQYIQDHITSHGWDFLNPEKYQLYFAGGYTEEEEELPIDLRYYEDFKCVYDTSTGKLSIERNTYTCTEEVEFVPEVAQNVIDVIKNLINGDLSGMKRTPFLFI